MKRKLRQGDKVVAIAGNEKGKSGTILLFKASDKVIVQGLNVRKKHVKKSEANPSGGSIDIEMPIHISNLSACDEKGVAVKLKTRINPEGLKERYYIQDGNEISYRSVKKS